MKQAKQAIERVEVLFANVSSLESKAQRILQL